MSSHAFDGGKSFCRAWKSAGASLSTSDLQAELKKPGRWLQALSSACSISPYTSDKSARGILPGAAYLRRVLRELTLDQADDQLARFALDALRLLRLHRYNSLRLHIYAERDGDSAPPTKWKVDCDERKYGIVYENLGRSAQATAWLGNVAHYIVHTREESND